MEARGMLIIADILWVMVMPTGMMTVALAPIGVTVDGPQVITHQVIGVGFIDNDSEWCHSLAPLGMWQCHIPYPSLRLVEATQLFFCTGNIFSFAGIYFHQFTALNK